MPESPSSEPWSTARPPRRPWWLWPALIAGGVCLLFLPPVKRAVVKVVDRLRRERVVVRTEVVEKIVEKRVEVPVPSPPPALPEGPSLAARKSAADMFSGIRIVSKVEPTPGGRATTERADADAYQVEVKVKLRVPKAATSYDELCGINPSLPVFFPALRDLTSSAKVSGFYHHLYSVKQQAIQSSVLRLDRLLSRHNLYDVETVLEIQNPASKQKALWLQGEMDVVSDGSDGDRMDSFDDYIFKSQHFQPSTSYAWPKQTTKQNPLIPRLEAEQKELKAKLGTAGATEKKTIQARLDELPRIIADLKKRSFLIAQEDPFVVIPLSFRNQKNANAFAPSIGDYAVVICGDRMLPAIVGDYGPAEKCGEASLRIARELDPTAGPYKRPVSDLKVTYLIFPDSAEKPRQPDYEAWHRRCSELLTALGADPAKLHRWEDRLKPKPPPAPPADPAASAASTAPATSSSPAAPAAPTPAPTVPDPATPAATPQQP